jgi:hypothetical protein
MNSRIKHIITITLILLSQCCFSQGESKAAVLKNLDTLFEKYAAKKYAHGRFMLEDSIIHLNDVYIAKDMKFIKATWLAHDFIPLTKPYADSTVNEVCNFMKKHENLVVEIGVHLDRIPKGYAEDFSWMQNIIFDSIARKGIDMKRLVAINYLSEQDVVPESEIIKIKNPETKELAYLLNNRVEFKIVSFEKDWMPAYFNMNDTTFGVNDLHICYYKAPAASTICIENRDLIDSIVNFMNKFPRVKIEIGAHGRYNKNSKSNDSLTLVIADHLRDCLLVDNIFPNRIYAHGYGNFRPRYVTKEIAALYSYLDEGVILDEEYIRNARTSNILKVVDSINRRIEIRILSK